MSQINDTIKLALTDQGFSGHINEMIIDWAQANGATSDQYNTAIMQALSQDPNVTGIVFNEKWDQYLTSQGYIDEEEYWSLGGGVRNFLQFNGTDIYGILDEPIVFSGDFEIEVKAAFSAAPTTTQVFSGSVAATDSFGAESGTQCRLEIADTVLTSLYTTVTPYDGNMHIWKASRIGAVGTITIDGVVQVSGAVPITDSSWGKLGGYAGTALGATSFFAGELEYIKFTDSITPTVTIFRMASGNTVYEQEVGAPTPIEKLPDPNLYDLATNWRIIQNQGLTFLPRGFRMATADTTKTSIADTVERSNTLLTEGKWYVIEVELENFNKTGTSSLGFDVYLGDTATDSLTISQNGIYQLFIKCSVSDAVFGDVYAVFSASAVLGAMITFDCIRFSVKEVQDSAALYNNIVQSDWISKRWNVATETWDIV